MINKEKVLEMLVAIGSYTEQELAQYAPVIDKDYDLLYPTVELCSASDESRYVYYIAAKTNYDIALIRESQSSLTSFKAGDVAFTESNDRSLAREIYLSAMADVRDLVDDNEFAFMDI